MPSGSVAEFVRILLDSDSQNVSRQRSDEFSNDRDLGLLRRKRDDERMIPSRSLASQVPHMLTRLRLLVLVAFATWSPIVEGAEPARAKRPNILFILVDDQSPLDLKVYNPHSALEAPHIERLAREGMTFDGAYHMGSHSGAVCTPSRHMIMSGRTLWHLPISPEGKTLCPPHLPQGTIPAVFNRAGYDTMRTCKQGNSYEAANQLFTVRHEATKRGPTDETGSPWHGERVLEYLAARAAAKDTDPFLIEFGFSHPHDERDGRPELLAKYGATNHTDKAHPPALNAKMPPLPPNYLPKHPFPHGHPNLRDEVDVSGVWERRDEATIRNEIGRQFACSENIDIQIGRVLKKLEELGELDNTYIFYTSDHGMAIGRHGLQGKQNLYQHTWRVPFIARGPGIKPGSRAEGNIYLLDILATFCDLTGVPAPESNEGITFKPVLEGKQQAIREVMYGAYCGGTKPGMRCVKQGDWKLIQYDVLDGMVREKQLFHLAQNPHEWLREHSKPEVTRLTGLAFTPDLVNLAGNPKYAEKQSEMESLLLSEMQRLDDPWRMWDQPEQAR